MAIGLLVDHVMHIALAYYESPEASREAKVKHVLRSMGTSILLGGLSTFIGTLPLAFTSSTVFYTVFVAFIAIVTLGLGHGLILLPVVLSMVGPVGKIAGNDQDTPDSDADSSLVDMQLIE